MTDALAKLPDSLSEVPLSGDGPFAIPACQPDIDIRVTATFATVVMKTLLEGKEVHVEFDHAVLTRLRDLADGAVKRLAAIKDLPPT